MAVDTQVTTFSETSIDAAWAAGIVDGEGCINMVRVSRTMHWSLRLQIGNTDIRMIDKLVLLFGGNVHLYRRKKSKDGYKRKPFWMWQVSGKEAARILNIILPYLIVKREQAELGLLAYTYLSAHKYTLKNSAEQLQKVSVLSTYARQLSELK